MHTSVQIAERASTERKYSIDGCGKSILHSRSQNLGGDASWAILSEFRAPDGGGLTNVEMRGEGLADILVK